MQARKWSGAVIGGFIHLDRWRFSGRLRSVLCRICSSSSEPFARATILGKREIEYFRCGACGFVQTEEPTWLEEAYSDAIAASDIGLIGRNLHLSSVTASVISRCFNAGARFLDYGGGYGMLVRLMRDRGFDFRWEDPFCRNLFAQGFERVPGEKFEALTAFEVFEHLPDPAAGFGEMMERSDSIFFSTELMPSGLPRPGEWWYYALDSGQHVSLYTREALTALGARFSCRLYTNGRSLHLLTKRSVSAFWFRLACSGKAARFFGAFQRRETLLSRDHAELVKRLARDRNLP